MRLKYFLFCFFKFDYFLFFIEVVVVYLFVVYFCWFCFVFLYEDVFIYRNSCFKIRLELVKERMSEMEKLLRRGKFLKGVEVVKEVRYVGL